MLLLILGLHLSPSWTSQETADDWRRALDKSPSDSSPQPIHRTMTLQEMCEGVQEPRGARFLCRFRSAPTALPQERMTICSLNVCQSCFFQTLSPKRALCAASFARGIALPEMPAPFLPITAASPSLRNAQQFGQSPACCPPCRARARKACSSALQRALPTEQVAKEQTGGCSTSGKRWARLALHALDPARRPFAHRLWCRLPLQAQVPAEIVGINEETPTVKRVTLRVRC